MAITRDINQRMVTVLKRARVDHLDDKRETVDWPSGTIGIHLSKGTDFTSTELIRHGVAIAKAKNSVFVTMGLN